MTKPNAIQILLAWLAVAITITVVLCSCKTTKAVTQTKTEYDSTAIHQRDSLSLEIKKQSELHKRELEEIRNTGVTFQPNCDTVIIDANCNYDSAMRIINALKNSVRINKDGSIEAIGKLSGAYSNLQSLSKQFDSLNSSYYLLQKEHEDSLTALHKLRDEYALNRTSKPAGIFSALTWMLIITALIGGGVLGYKLKRTITITK